MGNDGDRLRLCGLQSGQVYRVGVLLDEVDFNGVVGVAFNVADSRPFAAVRGGGRDRIADE